MRILKKRHFNKLSIILLLLLLSLFLLTFGCSNGGSSGGDTTYYKDADADGYGDPNDSVTESTQPDGYVTDNTDCDDSDASTHPGGTEVCGDSIDQDCSGADTVCDTFTGTFGGTGYESGYSLLQTSDGGYILLGSTTSNGAGGNDMYLVKLDASGNEDWSNTYGGIYDDYGYSLQTTSDGGYILLGETSSFEVGAWDFYLVKTDASGNEAWYKTYGGSGTQEGKTVRQTSDGGFILSGWTQSGPSWYSDMYIIKTGSTGIEAWNRTFPGDEDQDDFSSSWGSSIVQISGGGYVLLGSSDNFGAFADIRIILAKLDISGTYVAGWGNNGDGASIFGAGMERYAYSLQKTSDGGYILLADGNELIKTDSNGIEEWSSDFANNGYYVNLTSDGGFIIVGDVSVGSGNTDIYLVKVNSSGNEEWNKTFGGSSNDFGQAVIQTSDGGYALLGYTESYGAGSYDMYFIKTDSSGNVD